MDRDPIEILRAANPIKQDTYIDADAIIARVLASAPPTRHRTHILASFKVRIAAGITAAAAATVGIIVALSSLAAPSLVPLSLAASGSSATNGATPSMMICTLCNIAPYTFVASGLSNDASSAPVYVLTSLDPTASATALEAYLGLTSTTTTTLADNVIEVTSGTTTIDVSGSSLGSLYITDTSGLALPGTTTTTNAALLAAVQRLLASPAPGYQLVDPQITVTPPDSANSVAGDEYVSYSVSVEGHPITNLEISADFNTQGALLSLTAPLFTVASDTTYPLISPTAGVGTLNTEAQAFRNDQGSEVNPGGPMVPATTVPTTSSSTPPGPNATTAGSTLSPPVTIPTATSTPPATVPDDTTTTEPSVVTLTSDSLAWYLSALSSGQVAAIPVYSYSGTYADGASGGLNWRVPALDPSVVSIPSDWAPFQFWAWGHAIPMTLQGAVPPGLTKVTAATSTTTQP